MTQLLSRELSIATSFPLYILIRGLQSFQASKRSIPTAFFSHSPSSVLLFSKHSTPALQSAPYSSAVSLGNATATIAASLSEDGLALRDSPGLYFSSHSLSYCFPHVLSPPSPIFRHFIFLAEGFFNVRHRANIL